MATIKINNVTAISESGGTVTLDSGVSIPAAIDNKACAFSAYMSADQTNISEHSPDGATGYSVIQFNSTTVDTHSGLQTSGANQYKYVIPTGQGGVWLFNVGVLFFLADSTLRGYQVSLFNGSTAIEEDAQRYAGNDISAPRSKLSAITTVSAGDVMEVRMQTNTTTNARGTVMTDFYSAGNSHMNNIVNRASIFNGCKLGTA